jgi:N-acetyl sugar amidotransferase
MNRTDQPYRQCAATVMDTIADPDIRFDESGKCNYYHEFRKSEKDNVFTGEEGKKKLDYLVNSIMEDGRGKPYDCIVGLSGGVDSSYVAYKAKEFGLRPLTVHFDNGWNSELSVNNIENIVSKCGFDLYTLVVDWDEFRDIQLAYLKASVVDIEVVTDHAITATLFKLAKEHRIKYVLSGSNINTECIMPRSWIFNKNDHVNLLDIHKKFGTRPIKTYPVFDTYLKKYTNDILKAKWISFLNLIPYVKKDVKATITRELGWKDYGGKHYESIFTKFYQAYILPNKFKIDKRKPHLSNLIMSGQMTKDEAMHELSLPLYPEDQFRTDYEFVLKKFGMTHEEFDRIMKEAPRSHTEFKTELALHKRYPILKIIRPLINLIRK